MLGSGLRSTAGRRRMPSSHPAGGCSSVGSDRGFVPSPPPQAATLAASVAANKNLKPELRTVGGTITSPYEQAVGLPPVLPAPGAFAHRLRERSPLAQIFRAWCLG